MRLNLYKRYKRYKKNNKLLPLKDQLRSERRSRKFKNERFGVTSEYFQKFFWVWECLPNNQKICPSLVASLRKLPNDLSLVYRQPIGRSFFWDEMLFPHISKKWEWCRENNIPIPKMREWILTPDTQFIVLEFDNTEDMILFKMRF